MLLDEGLIVHVIVVVVALLREVVVLLRVVVLVHAHVCLLLLLKFLFGGCRVVVRSCLLTTRLRGHAKAIAISHIY